MALHLVAQPLDGYQTRGIFLGGDDELGRGEVAEGLVDATDVLLLEGVVIAECEHGDAFGRDGLEVVLHLFGRGNACEQHEILPDYWAHGVERLEYTHRVEYSQGLERLVAGQIGEDGFRRVVLVGGEEQVLVGIEFHDLRQDAELHRLHILWTLGDNDDIGTILALYRLTQTTCGQQLVVDDETVIVDEQDVDARLDVTVLEGIVEEDDVDILACLAIDEFLDTACTVTVDGQRDIRKLLQHLIGFVADLPHGGILIGQHEAMSLAFIAPTEDGYVHVILQQADEILHVRRLACTAYSDVAYGDDGHAERATLQDSHLEEQVPEAYAYAVKPTEWQ